MTLTKEDLKRIKRIAKEAAWEIINENEEQKRPLEACELEEDKT